MKQILIILLLHSIFLSCAQIYPLNTNTEVPVNAYIKDTNNELLPFEGLWKGTWDNKVFYINLIRIKKELTYSDNHIYFKDILVGKFKILDSNEALTMYDNTNLPNDDTKIWGGRFFTIPIKRYSLNYLDPDLCLITGNIQINLINSSNTQLNWKFYDTTDMLMSDCPYLNSLDPFPQPLPENIILTKQ